MFRYICASYKDDQNVLYENTLEICVSLHAMENVFICTYNTELSKPPYGIVCKHFYTT